MPVVVLTGADGGARLGHTAPMDMSLVMLVPALVALSALMVGGALQRVSGMGVGMIAGPTLSLLLGPVAGVSLANVAAVVSAVLLFALPDGAFAAAAAAMAVGALLCLRIRDLPVPASDPVAGEEPGPAGRPRLLDVARARRGALLTAGFGVVAVSAARAARNAVIPLWATHLGLDAATASLVFGLAGAADLLLFYPSGRLMDRFGRRAVAVPCLTLLGAGFLAISLTREPTAFAAAQAGSSAGSPTASTSSSLRSGAILTSSGTCRPTVTSSARRRTASSSGRSFSTACRSRRPGVFGDETLTTR